MYLEKSIELPGFSKNSYLRNSVMASMLTLDESSHVVDAENGVEGKNKVTHVTWFSFGTFQLWTENILYFLTKKIFLK